jgi:hypothetical protein
VQQQGGSTVRWWIVVGLGAALAVVGYLISNRLAYVAGAVVLAAGLAVLIARRGRRWIGVGVAVVVAAAIVGIPAVALRSPGSNVRWSADLEGAPSAVLATDEAIVTMTDDRVATFDMAAGLDRSTSLPGRVEFLSDAGDALVVAQSASAYTVLHVPDLRVVWQMQRTDDTARIQPLAADQGVVAFGSWAADGSGVPDRVFGIDDTGAQVWEQPLTGYDMLTLRIPFDDSTAILPSVVVGSVAGPGSRLRTLDARSGDLLDERTDRPFAATGDAVLWFPEENDGATTCSGTVTRHGEEDWTTDIPCPPDDAFGQTVLADRVVYEPQGGDEHDVTVDLRTGDVVDVPTDATVGAAEFAVPADGVVEASAIADGADLWRFDGHGPGPVRDRGPWTDLRADTAAVTSGVLDRNPMASTHWQVDGDQVSVLDAATGEVTGVVRGWGVGSVEPVSGGRAAVVVIDDPYGDATYRLVLVGRAS